MSDIETRYYPKIPGTEAIPFLVHAWGKLIERDLCEPGDIFLDHENGAVLAFVGGVAVGAISYSYAEWNRKMWIQIGFVKPPWRRMGIYTALWQRLLGVAADIGCQSIVSATNIGNAPMRATSAKFGRQETQVTLVYKLDRQAWR